MSKKDNLLKEAIADAKAVRETALANAKLALTEAFSPKLQSMLSAKLRNEMEGDFGEGDLNAPVQAAQEVDPTKLDIAKEAKDVTANADSDPEAEKAGAVAGGGGQGLEDKQGSGVKTVYEAEGEEEEEVPGEEIPGDVAQGGDIAPEGDVAPEIGGPEGEVAPEVGAPDGETVPPEEDDMELEAIIRELESEEEPQVAEPFAGEESPEEEEQEKLQGGIPQEAKDVTDIASEDPEKGLAGDVGPQSGSETALDTTPTVGSDTVSGEEELDLESLVKEIEGEMGIPGEEEEEDEEEKVQFENLRKENVTLKKALKEHRDVVVYLRDRLNEINLLNAKLLYSNKLFRGNSLSEGQKLRVVESIDRANTIREVKLVYATLAESFKAKGAKLNESKKPVPSASKTVKSTKPADAKVLNEGADLAARFKQLAGIKKVGRIL